MALLGSPLAHIRSRCTFARKCGAPGFALIEPSAINPIQNTYLYENVDAVQPILGLLSTALMEEQSGRHVSSPFFSSQGDASVDVGSLHNFTMDIRSIDPATNRTLTEFLALKRCGGTGEEMCKALVEQLGSGPSGLHRILKHVGTGVDGASCMTGKYEGFGAYLKEYCPFTMIVWCVCHRDALVMKGASEEDGYIESILDSLLPKLYTTYNQSDPRAKGLKDLQTEFGEKHNVHIQLAETRWLTTHSASERTLSSLHSDMEHVRTPRPSLPGHCLLNRRFRCAEQAAAGGQRRQFQQRLVHHPRRIPVHRHRRPRPHDSRDRRPCPRPLRNHAVCRYLRASPQTAVSRHFPHP